MPISNSLILLCAPNINPQQDLSKLLKNDNSRNVRSSIPGALSIIIEYSKAPTSWKNEAIAALLYARKKDTDWIIRNDALQELGGLTKSKISSELKAKIKIILEKK